MKARRVTYTFPDGTMQRVAVVCPDSWESLGFRCLRYRDPALKGFADIYQNYLVPACPWLFGNLVLFRLPEDVDVQVSMDCGRLGVVADKLTALYHAFRNGVYLKGGKPVFRDASLRAVWQALEERGCLYVVRGKLPTTQFIPVGNLPGYLSAEPGRLKVNASFFIMDPFDCATGYDHVGTPIGLRVKDGVIESPPLFGREALLVRGSGTTVETPRLEDMEIRIGELRLRHGENARIYSRPAHLFTPGGQGKRLVLVGDRVAAVADGGIVPVPGSGVVVCVEGECGARPGDRVIYGGMEDVLFGIQVGNSIVRDGEKTLRFRSRFYNIRALQPVPFPPSLYPMHFDTDRAARVALGADTAGKPMLLVAEGAPKLGYVPGKHSRGASLKDMAWLCGRAGMHNAVNLDGGGSAQVLLDGQRLLEVSDRNAADYTQQERAIPLALIVD